MNTQFANIATPSEIVVAVTFTIEFSGAASEMHVCLPYSMIEPIRDVLYSSLHSEQLSADKRWTGLLRQQLKTANVELIAPLGQTEITLGQIMGMQIGDIIPIDIDQTLTVAVHGAPVLSARYGVKNGQYALKIEKFLAQDQNQGNPQDTPSQERSL
jgi:flagellar motor switch protein FliM